MNGHVSALDAALLLASRGMWIFPALREKKKSHKSAEYSNGRLWGKTTDPAEIRRDFERWPDANLGIATGPDSGLWVVEIDTPQGHDVDGFASLRALEAEHGELPLTLMAESPSGSRHYYWKWPAAAVIRNSTSKIGAGIDVRGEGGMVIAPPSVKPGKGVYRWLNEEPFAEAPQWLIELANADNGERTTGEAEADPALIARALEVIPNDEKVGWADWNRIGMATWRATGGSGEGFAAFDQWSRKHPDYNERDTSERWSSYFKSRPTGIGAGTIFFMADEAKPGWRDGGITLDDFLAYLPQHNYIFLPTREPWPAAGVNARLRPVTVGVDEEGEPITISASTWLDRNKRVEQMTWAPGLPELIHDRLVADGGWIEKPEATCLNLYRPPTIKPGDPTLAGPWLDHIKKVYPEDADHLIKYFAQRRQRPDVKPNHAIVLGGAPGIGKDTLLEPIKCAVGAWNFREITPPELLAPFNPFAKSVILRVSEARDLGEINRYSFYEHMKNYTAAPPDVLHCNEKNLRQHYVVNCCGVVITTNYTDGLYLPADDRRHYVAWSELTVKDFEEGYWRRLWSWYEGGGIGHVAAYLDQLDLSSFDPKAPPKKTEAFRVMVDANRSTEDAELADILDSMGTRNPGPPEVVVRPKAVTLALIRAKALEKKRHVFCDWLDDRKNRKAIPHRLKNAGYNLVPNEGAEDRYHVIDGRRRPVYARKELAPRERTDAVAELQKDHPKGLEDAF